MKTLTQLALAALLLAPLPALAAPVVYPSQQATDTTGTPVTSGVTASVASVTDLDGNAIASPGAVAHVAGGNVSVVYDAAAHGEAWVTETLSATGHTFNPIITFCSNDPNGISTAATGATSNGSQLSALTLALTPVRGAIADAGSSTTVLDTNVLASFNIAAGDGIVITSGPYQGKSTHVASYNSATGQMTLTSVLPGVLANGTTFSLLPYNLALVNFLATLGSDSKPVLSATQAYTNATPATVTPLWYTAPPTPAQIAAVTSSYAADGPAAVSAGTSLVLTITHNGSGQPVLTWTADSAATSYKVLRSTDGINYAAIATPAAGVLTFTDTTRPAGGTVYYHVVTTH